MDLQAATEHVYKNLLQWSYNLSEAIENHKETDGTMEATRRSGGHTGKSGLTVDEVQNRADKSWRTNCYEYAQGLNEEIRNYKDKGNKGYGKGAKSTKSKGQQGKRSFDEMTLDEQWWLDQLWNGIL